MNIFKSVWNFFKNLFQDKTGNKDKITVKQVLIEGDGLCYEKKEKYCFVKDSVVRVMGSRYLRGDGKDHNFELVCTFKKGFVSDGASVPSFAQKYLPDVKTDDDVYSAAPFLHDALYILKGEINVDIHLSREECDDILRGVWRCSGVDRGTAAAADIGVGLVAGTDDHWGNGFDELGKFIEFSMKYI